MIGNRYADRSRHLQDLSEEELRLKSEREQLEELVARVASADGDVARMILDHDVIRGHVIDPLLEEAERLGRLALEKIDMTPAEREAHVLARRLMKKFVNGLTFRKSEREGYFKKLWRDFIEHVRGTEA